jgi:multiple sugar transport system permease protein
VHRHRQRATKHGVAGWTFVVPTIVVLGLFLLIPVLMAAWVSVSDWNGSGSPFSAGVHFVGGKNYAAILNGHTLKSQNFGISIRNNLYYVLLVVPIQTAVSLFLAVMVTRRRVLGRGFFQTAFYFPSVTSSVAITVLWLFLFNATGAVNKVLGLVSLHGPNWFHDPDGIFSLVWSKLGLGQTGALGTTAPLGITWWDWIAGPSVAMSAYILMGIFTTSGTFMLLFIAGIQNISTDTEEAAMIDGANAWNRFWHVTLPLLKPTVFTVITLGLIGTWEVFDQIYTGTQGSPAKTTLTPAYLSYQDAFSNNAWGSGAAIAFVLFAIIVIFTILQRVILGGDVTRLARSLGRRIIRRIPRKGTPS